MSGIPGAPRILVKNSQRALLIRLSELQRFAEIALAQAWRSLGTLRERLCGIEEISVILVSDRRIAALHGRFMKIAGPTDVITFQHGEIFISVETAVSHAAEYATTPGDEIRLYIVHGILHLSGFDDATDRAAKRMELRQARIFKAAMRITAANCPPADPLK